MYGNSPSQDTTNVLNSNEKIPVRLFVTGINSINIELLPQSPIREQSILSFQELP